MKNRIPQLRIANITHLLKIFKIKNKSHDYYLQWKRII
jgi:hypothetical protein